MYIIGGGSSAYVFGVNGAFTDSKSYKEFVLAYLYGIEIDVQNAIHWLPSLEILFRNEITNIYEHNRRVLINSDVINNNRVEHKVKSLAVQLVFSLS